MSKGPARSRMIHRARVLRNSQVNTDPYGNPSTPVFDEHVASQPCFFWTVSTRAIADRPTSARTVLDEEHHMTVPKDADVIRGDVIDGIQDRRGSTIFADKMKVVAAHYRITHRELVLEAFTG